MARSPRSNKAPPSIPGSINDFAAELNRAGVRSELAGRVDRLLAQLTELGLEKDDRELVEIGRAAKKNFAQRFSTAIAQKIADALRPQFQGIKPGADGRDHESQSRGARGLKKLDVNYSKVHSGLELAISVKTINFRDVGSGRYTKNAKRVDGELRAEAQDCHTRQPFSVLAAFVFLPVDAASDGKGGQSSLKHIAQILSQRAGREQTDRDHSLFEFAYLVLYRDDGEAVCFVADDRVPTDGLPGDTLTFEQALAQITAKHRERNK